jgi:DNA polymerase elongation subunit (family B)
MEVVKPKILVVDIETAPAEFWGWGMFNQNFGVNQIKKSPYILCVGAQWLGDKDVMMFSKWEHGTEGMLQAISDLITEADMIIGKNSERFDVPWLMTEFVKYGITIPPPTTHLDLEKIARKNFRFLSNKLEYIVDYFGVGKKINTHGFELWEAVMEGSEVARRKMLRYCARDVKITGKLYLKMRPAIPNHPHMGFTPKKQCGACGSHHVHVSKWRRTKAMRIQQLHCQTCGSYFDGIRQKVQ